MLYLNRSPQWYFFPCHLSPKWPFLITFIDSGTFLLTLVSSVALFNCQLSPQCYFYWYVSPYRGAFYLTLVCTVVLFIWDLSAQGYLFPWHFSPQRYFFPDTCHHRGTFYLIIVSKVKLFPWHLSAQLYFLPGPCLRSGTFYTGTRFVSTVVLFPDTCLHSGTLCLTLVCTVLLFIC